MNYSLENSRWFAENGSFIAENGIKQL